MNILQALLCLTLLLYCHAILPSTSRVSSAAFLRNNASYLPLKHTTVLNGLAFRGGSSDEVDSDEYDSEDVEDLDSDSDDVEDLDSDSDDEEDESEDDEEEEDQTEDDEEVEEEEDEDEDDEEEEEIDEDDEEEEGESSAIPSSPAKITLKTALTNHVLIDQSIEITASPTRNVASLKQSVSRQFKSRPPMDAIVLRLDGQVLDDEILVQDLVDDMEDDDDDDEQEEDDDGLPKLTIIVDMVPPVDPKFGTEMRARLDEMTNQQVLDAYIANLASLHQNSLDIMEQSKVASVNDENEATDDDVDVDGESILSAPPRTIPQTNLDMQRHIMMLRDQVLSNLSENCKKLLEKTDTPSSPIDDDLDSYDGDLLLKESIKRKKRKGGATMNVKRALQKNLNINWPDTIRNFLLFLFFGYFGGRNAMSRTIMLLGAPACFIIQARPVKVAIKQMFYTIGEPPGILLSLLPAPQQAIMSCDYDEAMRTIYGNSIGDHNDLIKREAVMDNDAQEESDVEDTDLEDEYDEYDDDY